MRALNFRDNVLWNIARRLGYDPVPPPNGAGDLFDDDAAAIVNVVNAWVRRLFPSFDFPEWTEIAPFYPANHIVPYSGIASDSIPSLIDKTLKVYLCDPRVTPTDGLDTPHKLLVDGVHVGFEHGPRVWIKYQSPPPQFTSEKWDATRKYAIGDLTYSPVTGECYKSLINNNVGHDPSQVGPPPGPIGHNPPPPPDPDNPEESGLTSVPLATEVIQAWMAQNPGIASVPKIMRIDFTRARPGPAPPDPAPNGEIFAIAVTDSAGAALASVSYTAVGPTALATVITALKTSLDAALVGLGFTITVNLTSLAMQLTRTSEFRIDIAPPNYTEPNGVQHNFATATIQNFLPGSLVTGIFSGASQMTKVTLSASQVYPGNRYTLTFTDPYRQAHTVAYTALPSDGPAQVLAGLAGAIEQAVSTDDYFSSISAMLDAPGQSLTFTRNDPFNLNASLAPSQALSWVIVRFPAQLVEPVVRGALGDKQKEQGQQDKGDAEEQAVPREAEARVAAIVASQFDALTDQDAPRTRYAIK